MQLISKLDKPCTDVERENFIVEYNHQQGCKIKETEEDIEAWGYTDEEKAQEREIEFNKAFFLTSLGYVRRSVTMADSSHKDFLSDLMPVIKMGLETGMPVNILTYDKPPFDEDVTDWTEYQHQVVVTPQFIQECFLQLSADFAPINNEE